MRLNLQQSGPWIGIVGVLMVLFIGFPALFLYAPPLGVALILGLAVVQMIVIFRLAKRHPEWCVWVPVVGLVVYFLMLYSGVKWWGWG